MTIHKPTPKHSIRIASAINLCIMLSLAWWQIHRAYHKYELLNTKPQGALHTNELRSANQLENNQLVHFHLPINKKNYFMIDPAIYQHQVGVELVATGYAREIGQSVIIHLGWHPNRQAAQRHITTYNEQQGVKGLLYKPRGKLLQTQQLNTNWPRVLAYLDTASIESTLKTKVLSYAVITESSALYEQLNNGHILHLGITRHICYALQFIAFGLIGVYYSRQLSTSKSNICI